MAVEDFQVSRDGEVGARRGQGERLVEAVICVVGAAAVSWECCRAVAAG